MAERRADTSEVLLRDGVRVLGAGLRHIQQEIAEVPLTDDRFQEASAKLDEIETLMAQLSTEMGRLEGVVAAGGS